MQTNHSDASTLHDSSDSSLKTPAKAKTASEPPDAYKDNADKSVVFVLGENERLNECCALAEEDAADRMRARAGKEDVALVTRDATGLDKDSPLMDRVQSDVGVEGCDGEGLIKRGGCVDTKHDGVDYEVRNREICMHEYLERTWHQQAMRAQSISNINGMKLPRNILRI